MTKVAIIGYGRVGKAMKEVFPDALIYDPIVMESSTKQEINKSCELAIICVPTPANADGSCDICIVQEVVAWLRTPLILIKSTVAPGTTNRLKQKYSKRIVFSPEFVGESKYYHGYPEMDSMVTQPYMILGGSAEDTREVLDMFLPILGPAKTYYQIKAMEAEIVKYMENCFFAMKVVFANEFYDICKLYGADYDQVRNCWGADPRINISHTAVFKNNRAYGGKCYPKDVKALIVAAKGKAQLLERVDQINRTREFVERGKECSGQK